MTEEQAATRARLDQEYIQQDLLQREMALEILRLRNQRAQAEIAFLRKHPTFVPPASSSNLTNGAASPATSAVDASVPITRSSTIIKECEKALVQNLLTVSAPKQSFLWLQKIVEYINYAYVWPRAPVEFFASSAQERLRRFFV